MNGSTVSIFDSLNLIGYWRVLTGRKRVVVSVILLGTLIGVIISLILPKTYRAEATIMPIGGGGIGGLAAIAVQMSGLEGGGGMGKPQREMMAVLKSRTLAETMIVKYDLFPILFGKKSKEKSEGDVSPAMMERAVMRLRNHISIADSLKGIIIISAVFNDPKIAAEVVNGYIKELRKMLNEKAFTMAKRNRIFLEGQLAQSKRELLLAGKELNEFYKGGKISNVDSQIDVQLDDHNNDMDNVKAELQVADPASGAKDWPDTLQILQEKKKEVDSILNDTGKRGEILKNVPQQIYLQYLSLRRDLLVRINVLLSERYEMAKVEEAKEGLVFEVIDHARVPVSRYSPNRKNIVMTFFVFSTLLAIISAFLVEYHYTRRAKNEH